MKIIKKFLILLIVFISIAALIEGATRLFFRIASKDIDVYRNFSFTRRALITMPDSMLGYKLMPNVSRNAFTSDFQVIYKTNSIGLREKEIENTDKFKIIFLGDSMTFGEGVPYGSRFSDLIEKEIKGVYTINTGVPGYGIHQMCSWLRHYGMNLAPNLVICSIIPASLNRTIYKKINESSHLLIPRQDKAYGETRINHWGSYFKKMNDRLLIKSYFYSLVKVKIAIMRISLYLKERDRKVWDGIRKKGGRGNQAIDGQEEMVRKESAKVFLDFKDICDRAQIKFLVINISKEPLPWLSDFLMQHNIEYLDISHKLKEISKTISFEIDPHYNVTGNRVIADLLREYISNRYKNDIEN